MKIEHKNMAVELIGSDNTCKTIRVSIGDFTHETGIFGLEVDEEIINRTIHAARNRYLNHIVNISCDDIERLGKMVLEANKPKG